MPSDGMVFIEDILGAQGARQGCGAGWPRAVARAHAGHRVAKRTPDSLATVIFSSGSTGVAQGRDAVALQHPFEHRSHGAGVLDRRDGSHRGRAAVLPLLRFHGDHLVPAAHRLRRGLSSESDGREIHRRAGLEIQRNLPALDADVLRGYARKCTREEFATLRYVLVGAEKLREPVAKAFQEKFGVELLEGYGCTEMSPVVAVNAPNFEAGRDTQIGNKPGTVGQPLAGRRVRRLSIRPRASRCPPAGKGCCW